MGEHSSPRCAGGARFIRGLNFDCPPVSSPTMSRVQHPLSLPYLNQSLTTMLFGYLNIQYVDHKVTTSGQRAGGGYFNTFKPPTYTVDACIQHNTQCLDFCGRTTQILLTCFCVNCFTVQYCL